MTKITKRATKQAPRPRAGGSYTRDPKTLELTKVIPEAASQATEQGPVQTSSDSQKEG